MEKENQSHANDDRSFFMVVGIIAAICFIGLAISVAFKDGSANFNIVSAVLLAGVAGCALILVGLFSQALNHEE